MEINGAVIDDTYAEAFAMRFARILVTAKNPHWLSSAINSAIGYATSIVGCEMEGGLECYEKNTPDGREGACLLFFAYGEKKFSKDLAIRIGQTILTCPTASVYNGLDGGVQFPVGASLRFFGDGHEIEGNVGNRKVWKIPVSSGEFIVEENISIHEGVGGGQFIITGDEDVALESAKSAVEAIETLSGIILPFPGGVCGSASKVGSRYKFLKASTNEKFVPSITGGKPSFEIVIDGRDMESVAKAMRKGILAAVNKGGSAIKISSANFGGALGNIRIGLHDVINAD